MGLGGLPRKALDWKGPPHPGLEARPHWEEHSYGCWRARDLSDALPPSLGWLGICTWGPGEALCLTALWTAWGLPGKSAALGRAPAGLLGEGAGCCLPLAMQEMSSREAGSQEAGSQGLVLWEPAGSSTLDSGRENHPSSVPSLLSAGKA